LLLMMSNRLGIESTDGVIYKAMKLIDKGVSVTHILAEVLIYSYVKNEGYNYISIEETIGSTKCDVYAESKSRRICIEIETHSIPVEYILDGYHYIIARHIKKILQIAKEESISLTFAYPYGVVPLIPLELLKKPEERSEEELERVVTIARKFYAIDYNSIMYLKNWTIKYVYIYDMALLRVIRLPIESLTKIVHMYIELIH
ncbi:MAG: hypothetical protein QXI40_03635, partial [Ignisphaera sp.]